jgi:hypothetical protein
MSPFLCFERELALAMMMNETGENGLQMNYGFFLVLSDGFSENISQPMAPMPVAIR